MSTANEAAIERAYEAFGTGDMEAIRNESFACAALPCGPMDELAVGAQTRRTITTSGRIDHRHACDSRVLSINLIRL